MLLKQQENYNFGGFRNFQAKHRRGASQLKHSTENSLQITLLLFISAFISPCVFSLSQVQVKDITSGQAEFKSEGNTLTVNVSSDKLIVNYNSFSIGESEIVRFNQISPASIVLNRVVGKDYSSILGTLSANGQIFLINPNGIIFGSGCKVDAAGLVASTLDIADQDFLSNDFKFSGKTGYIINQGSLSTNTAGGFICLLAGAIDSPGTITANSGTIVLATGQAITLDLDPAGQISVMVDKAVESKINGPDKKKIKDNIKTSGKISANQGRVIIDANSLNDVFDYAVNNSGLIEAQTLDNIDGQIILRADGSPVSNSGIMQSGSITAQSEKDFSLGEIHALDTATLISLKGGLIDNNGNSLNIIADTAKLSAATVIVSNNTLETEISRLSGVNTLSGKILINNSKTLTIDGAGLINYAGKITLSTQSSLSVNSLISALDDISLNVGEAKDSNSNNLLINNDLISNQGGIDLTAGDDIIQGMATTIKAAKDINFDAGYLDKDSLGSIKQVGNAQVLGENGAITLRADGDIELGLLDAGLGSIKLSAGGRINGNGTSFLNIRGDTLIMSSDAAIGEKEVVKVKVNKLCARITRLAATGAIKISNASDLLLSDWDNWGYAVKNTGFGNIEITAPRIILNFDILSKQGDIRLEAESGIDKNADIVTEGGNIFLLIKSKNNLSPVAERREKSGELSDGALFPDGSSKKDKDKGIYRLLQILENILILPARESLIADNPNLIIRDSRVYEKGELKFPALQGSNIYFNRPRDFIDTSGLRAAGLERPSSWFSDNYFSPQNQR